MSTPKKLFRMDAAIGSSIYNAAENTNFNVGDVIYTQDINTGQCMGCSALTQEIADLKNMITQQNVAMMEAFAELRGDFKKILAETETNKNIMDNFPIQNLEDLEKMEKKICPENQAKYIQTFKRSLKGKLTKTLTNVLDSKLLLEVNVEGIQKKERLKNYKSFYNALIEAIDEADPDQALRKAINTIKKRHHHKVCVQKKQQNSQAQN